MEPKEETAPTPQTGTVEEEQTSKAPTDTSTKPGETPEEKTPTLEEKYQKSLEHSNRLAGEIGKLKKELEGLTPYKTYYDQQQFASQYQTKPETSQAKPAEPEDDDDLISKKEVQKMIYEAQTQASYQSAYQEAENAKFLAKQQYPQAFEGVEDARVDQAMYGGVQARQINPALLKSPQGWAMAAWQIKGQDSKFTLNTNPTSPNPTQTTPAESPEQRKPPEEPSDEPTRPSAQALAMAGSFKNPETGLPYTEKEIAEMEKRAIEERQRREG